MKVLVIGSFLSRVKRYLTERRLAESLVRLGYDVTVWCSLEGEGKEEIEVLGGKMVIVGGARPPDISPSIIFWVTGTETTPYVPAWLDLPFFFIVPDLYGQARSKCHKALLHFVKLRDKGFPIHFIAFNDVVAKEIGGARVIKGRVPDEAFLFPEELCVEKENSPIITWMGNDINKRTALSVWQHLVDNFPHTVFFFSEQPDIHLKRNCIVKSNLTFLKSLQVIYRSAATLAPYSTQQASYVPFQNPLKYWDSVALNTPVVVSNCNIFREGMQGAIPFFSENVDELKDFFSNTVKKILENPQPFKPFKDSSELKEWRMKNSFTRNLARTLVEVLGKEWQFPQQLSQYLDIR